MTTFRSDFLNIMQERGFIHQSSDLPGLDKKLCEGVQSAYIGFDATAKSLHIGNLTGIMMLHWFQKSGHKPVTLMGGGTSKIGDPSFKDEQRKLLDDATIGENIRNIEKTCFAQFLAYGTGKTDALMVNNNEWLDGLKYLDFLRDYGRYFTVNRMLSFDSVKQRLERESPLTLLEFNYMVMQGYDFLELNRRYGTVLQMGGSDQWGNIVNGVDLAHKADQKQLFALTAPLLTTPDGKKMGKTESGAVWLNAAMLKPYDYYQYWRNADDVMVGPLLRRFTVLPMDEIRRLDALQGQEINEAKKILAFEATKLCHDETAAHDAAATAQRVFEQGGVGEGLTVVTSGSAQPISDWFIGAGFASSRGELARLVKQSGISYTYRNKDVVITTTSSSASDLGFHEGDEIRINKGKKKSAIVKISDKK